MSQRIDRDSLAPHEDVPGGVGARSLIVRGKEMNDEMTDAERIDQRLMDLEVKTAFMDDLLERLNEVLVRQQDQIDRLTAELRRWQDQADAATGPAPRNLLEEKPPHW